MASPGNSPGVILVCSRLATCCCIDWWVGGCQESLWSVWCRGKRGRAACARQVRSYNSNSRFSLDRFVLGSTCRKGECVCRRDDGGEQAPIRSECFQTRCGCLKNELHGRHALHRFYVLYYAYVCRKTEAGADGHALRRLHTVLCVRIQENKKREPMDTLSVDFMYETLVHEQRSGRLCMVVNRTIQDACATHTYVRSYMSSTRKCVGGEGRPLWQQLLLLLFVSPAACSECRARDKEGVQLL